MVHLRERGISSAEALAEALGRPVSENEGLTDHTVVAYWPALEFYTFDDEHLGWTSALWAEHLDDPNWQHPYAVSAQDDRRAVFHATIQLLPSGRVLNAPEWSEIAHRFARTARLALPGDEQGCRWIAVQAQRGRLDLIGNLIRLDGIWQDQGPHLDQRLASEARRLECDLQLVAPASHISQRHPFPSTVATLGQVNDLLRQLTDEAGGPLASVRRLVEQAADNLDALPDASGRDAGHRLL